MRSADGKGYLVQNIICLYGEYGTFIDAPTAFFKMAEIVSRVGSSISRYPMPNVSILFIFPVYGRFSL